MRDRWFKKILTFYDKVLIISLLIISLAFYMLFALYMKKSPDDSVVVKQGEKVVLQLTKEEIKKGGIFAFKFDGGSGQVEVKDNRVRMLPMDREICPQAICSKTGWIDGSPKVIVCAPNRLVVSFKSIKNSELDGVTF